jgi:NADH-quinone oxidoreductase subunit F
MKPHFLLPESPFARYAEYLAGEEENAVDKARRIGARSIIQKVKQSGLRGRGGAGYPAGRKWETIAKHPCRRKFVVCNAAEGEPGTFKDRWLLRRNPYAVIEGMLIAAAAIGTTEIFFATKASYGRELARVREALDEMRAAKRLEGIDFRVFEGPEEYLFGEEKALLNAIEGGLPMPREAHQPPYEFGLFAGPRKPNPALVNNAETFAHVPSILRHGAQSFRQLGTHDTPGTILLTLSGDVRKPGVYEAEAGITLKSALEKLAGGARPGRKLRAALCGVSAAVIPASKFDTPLEFRAMRKAGMSLGSAGFVAIDDATSIPRVAQSVARFLYVESCDQCSACKHGLGVASLALDMMFDGRRADHDLAERALYGAKSAPQGNRCFLPVQGALLIPSLVEHFKADFEAAENGKGRDAAEWPIPKFLDFDEGKGRFILDEMQRRKQPDWRYEGGK